MKKSSKMFKTSKFFLFSAYVKGLLPKISVIYFIFESYIAATINSFLPSKTSFSKNV